VRFPWLCLRQNCGFAGRKGGGGAEGRSTCHFCCGKQNFTPLPAGLFRLRFSLGSVGGLRLGLAASLTPCVYPMIPITMAIVGAKGSGRMKGSCSPSRSSRHGGYLYHLGDLCRAEWCGLRCRCSKTRLPHPVSLLFAAFALSLFGAYEIALPAGLATKLQGSGPRNGFGGAFIMGLVLGPLAAPCVGPFVGTVLVNIAQHQGVISGALQLFVFALGMGVLFIAVGTFNAALPKSGHWLTRFKHVMGLVVLGFAAWNVRLIVPAWANFGMWALVTVVGAAVLACLNLRRVWWANCGRALPSCCWPWAFCWALIRGVIPGVELLPKGGTTAAAKDEHAGWLEQDLEGALARAKAEHKLVLVDIYADWCAQCKNWTRDLAETSVKQWIAQNAVPIRIDTDAGGRPGHQAADPQLSDGAPAGHRGPRIAPHPGLPET